MIFQPLRNFLDENLAMLGIPGSDTSIYHKGKEIFRYQSGYGNLKNRTPVDPKGLYNIFSCTKVATMCALLTLFEKGEIHLYDPVYAYLPTFRDLTVRFKKENGEWDVRPAETTMTVRHLMSMTSGMNYDLSAAPIREVYERTNGRCPTVETVSAMAKIPLQFDPGTNYNYSLSHDVVGAIVEVVSGMSFGEYMKKAIFDPIGMNDTSFVMNEERAARMNTQYKFNPETRMAEELSPYELSYRLGSEYESGGAGLSSRVDDYVLLADMLAHKGLATNGNRILAESTVDLMRTNVLTGKAMNTFETTVGVRMNGYGYGLGVRTMLDPGVGASLSPVGEFGWDGAKLCYLAADPKNEIAVFHAEHMGYFHDFVLPRLRNVIYSCLGRL